MRQIINHILDDDLYKFSMQYAVINMFPYAKVRYEFINRGKTKFPEGFRDELQRQIELMENIQLSKEQKEWFKETCPYFPPTYFDFLYGYRFDSSEVQIYQINGNLQISIEGFWTRTILWEVPLLALISELYYEMTGKKINSNQERENNNIEKAKFFASNNIKVAEFGSRRRYSYENQDKVIQDFLKVSFNNFLIGTSNVHFAHKYKLTPIGTMAHEWIMFHAAKYGYKMANYMAMKNWSDVYNGDLGIVLPDTFTTDIFLKSFDKKYSKLFDGCRVDSGNPIEFASKIISHYKKHRIDPLSKSIVFSDSLNKDIAYEIYNFCLNKIKCSFGIGTNLSNDVGLTPLSIVIKMKAAKPEGSNGWIPTIKLSDALEKYTGNPKEIKLVKQILNLT